MDIYFLCNAAMDFVLLLFATGKKKGRIPWKRILWGALFGGFFAVVQRLIFLVFGQEWSIFFFLFGGLCMVRIALGKKKLLANLCKLCFFAVLFSGIITLLDNVLQGSVLLKNLLYHSEGSIPSAVLFLGIFLSGLASAYLTYKKKKSSNILYPVTLIYGEKVISAKALWDTGNHLRTPRQRPVNVISKELWGKLFENVPETALLPQWIPYHGVGQAKGLMKVVFIDYIVIHGEEEYAAEGAAVGLSEMDYFYEKDVSVILNAEIAGGVIL